MNPVLRRFLIILLEALLAILSGGAVAFYVSTHLSTRSAPPVNDASPPRPEEVVRDPIAATVQLRTDRGWCSAVTLDRWTAAGEQYVLTAAHCVEYVGQQLVVRTDNGRSVGVRVLAVDRESDCALLVTSTPVRWPCLPLEEDVEGVSVGDDVFHVGFGVDRPRNREHGTVKSKSEPQWQYRLSVSPGDSGAPVVHSNRNTILGVVCCTTHLGRTGTVWAASPQRLAALLKRPTFDVPITLPIREDHDGREKR